MTGAPGLGRPAHHAVAGQEPPEVAQGRIVTVPAEAEEHVCAVVEQAAGRQPESPANSARIRAPQPSCPPANALTTASLAASSTAQSARVPARQAASRISFSTSPKRAASAHSTAALALSTRATMLRLPAVTKILYLQQNMLKAVTKSPQLRVAIARRIARRNGYLRGPDASRCGQILRPPAASMQAQRILP